jgi:hypothetical protein
MVNSKIQNPALYSTAMKFLREKFVVLAVEEFIADVRSDSFDYTEWRQTQPWYTEDNLSEFLAKAAANDPIGKSLGL